MPGLCLSSEVILSPKLTMRLISVPVGMSSLENLEILSRISSTALI